MRFRGRDRREIQVAASNGHPAAIGVVCAVKRKTILDKYLL